MGRFLWWSEGGKELADPVGVVSRGGKDDSLLSHPRLRLCTCSKSILKNKMNLIKIHAFLSKYNTIMY